jgi:hypothetical protein
MSLTLNEMKQLLKDYFTSEELCELLELEPEDIVEIFQEEINDKYEEILNRIQEETGYGKD